MEWKRAFPIPDRLCRMRLETFLGGMETQALGAVPWGRLLALETFLGGMETTKPAR